MLKSSKTIRLKAVLEKKRKCNKKQYRTEKAEVETFQFFSLFRLKAVAEK